ncbi:sterol desaturase family protein [Corallococcus exercitus]|uniref:sterol desaturase family protein n=1 Tax=Corallococcus exercitus TaxID=2316736 RepID=UPI0026C98E4F
MAVSFLNRKHNLDRMSLRDLVYSFFTYYAVVAYILIGITCIVLSVKWFEAPARMAAAVLVATVAYPFGWYLIHRYILHGRFLYKSAATAVTWKRIHFDHHQDPHDLRVLFGALHTTLPTIALVLTPIGYLIGGRSGAAAALGWGMVTTCFYEFCHCIQHLNYAPQQKWLKDIKRLHMSHHFHNEQGNYGITNYFWDRLFGTLYEKASDKPKSATVFNLGYTAEEAAKYPWVDKLSGGTRGDGHPRRFWGAEGLSAPEASSEQQS